LHDAPSDKTSPTTLVRRTETSSVVSVEELNVSSTRNKTKASTHLVEMDVVSEVGVPVELGVASVDGTSTRVVSAENVDDTMLNLFSDSSEVHELQVS